MMKGAGLAVAAAALMAGMAAPALAQTTTAAAAASVPAPPPAPKPQKPRPKPAKARKAQADDDQDDDDPDVVQGITIKAHTVRPQPGAVVGDIKPELQLSPADIQSYGVSTVTELLNELSPQTRSDRGRGASTPVVLLNGRRISSLNEIQNIPTEAILRVDILPEEVSLKYGYSADQRVVNFVLKRRFRAVTGEISGGETTAGGDPSGQAEVDQFKVQRDTRLNLDVKYQAAGGLTDADRKLTDITGGVDAAADHSLLPQTQQLTANAVLARPVIGGMNATFNATLGATDSTALQGLPGVMLTVPAGDPFAPAGAPTTVDRAVTGQGPLRQTVQGWTGHLGVTLNRELGDWRLSLTSAYNHADTVTVTGAGLDASGLQSLLNQDSTAFNPFGPLPAGALPGLPDNTARSITDGGNIQLLANGPLFKVPAGAVYVSAKLGDAEAGGSSNSQRMGFSQSQSLSRNDVSALFNLDLPLASRTHHVLGALGELSVNVNTAVDDYSDFGALTTMGFGVNWTPVPGYNLIVSETHDHAAPTIQQLDGAMVQTPGTRLFDYLTGQTAAVTQISGGNPALVADDRHVFKVGLTLKPLPDDNFTVTANFIDSHIANPIETFPSASAAIEAAFPARFLRGADGELDEVDFRPLNFASQDREELRWGVNYSRPIGKQPPPPSFDRRAFQRRRAAAAMPAPGDPDALGPNGPGAPGAAPPDADAAARTPGPGAGGGSGGGRGFGGGGGGGFGGRGGRGGGGIGPPVGGRLQFALYHTMIFKDQFQVARGGPLLDLLNGAAAGNAGGQYQHEIEAQLGFTDKGYGARLSADWRSATTVTGGAAGSTGNLEFSDVSTVNVRLWDDFTQQRALTARHPILRGVRVTFNVNNLFDQSVHVRDTAGPTPLIYQSAFLDPTGRVVSISLRKLFY
jgi:iron complex outermembrane receptor protein